MGDRLRVHGRTVGQREHRAEILEVRGTDGGPPYLVRHDDGHEAVVFPGPDAVVEPMTDPPPGAGLGVAAGGETSFQPEEDPSAAPEPR